MVGKQIVAAPSRRYLFWLMLMLVVGMPVKRFAGGSMPQRERACGKRAHECVLSAVDAAFIAAVLYLYCGIARSCECRDFGDRGRKRGRLHVSNLLHADCGLTRIVRRGMANASLSLALLRRSCWDDVMVVDGGRC